MTLSILCYEGGVLNKCLVKTFNRIVALEQNPAVLNEGLVIPIHKGKGKDPFIPGSYRSISLSSVTIKLFEIMILHRLTPVLEEVSLRLYRNTISAGKDILSWCEWKVVAFADTELQLQESE